MSGNLLKLCFAVAIFFLASSLGAGVERALAHPNIVLILIDDLGWGDFSCFGNRRVQTPNIDRLAAEGLRFEQFYVNSPVCSPTRTAISTGQYPQRWRITSYLASRQLNDERGMAQWLDPSAPMLARMLQTAGYATGHFGKWHLGGQRDVGEAPLITDYGFDESLTQFEGLGRRILPLLDAFDGQPPQKHALGSDKLGRGPIVWQRRDTVTASYIEAAWEFITKAKASGRPFYVNLWPDDVHTPLFPPEGRRGNGTKRARYAGVLTTLDEQVGVLFERIRDGRVAAGQHTDLGLFGQRPGAGCWLGRTVSRPQGNAVRRRHSLAARGVGARADQQRCGWQRQRDIVLCGDRFDAVIARSGWGHEAGRRGIRWSRNERRVLGSIESITTGAAILPSTTGPSHECGRRRFAGLGCARRKMEAALQLRRIAGAALRPGC